jgi:TatD DNase family protein
MFSPIIDSHCHLVFPEFSPDLEKTIARARGAGVEEFINSGVDFKTNISSLELAGQYDCVHATVGLSPSVVSASKELAEAVLDQLTQLGGRAVGIGEAGMDFHYFRDRTTLRLQRDAFSRVINIADNLGKPLVIHGRDAEEECFTMSKDLETVIFHCYGGSVETMRKITDAGHYISIPPLVCSSRRHQAIVKDIPPELMLLETDSPYLSPKKGRNEPAYLVDSLETIARILDMTAEDVAGITTKNTKKAFKI